MDIPGVSSSVFNCLFVRLSVCLSVSTFCLFICQSAFLSRFSTSDLSVCYPACRSITRMFNCHTVCYSVYTSACLSDCPSLSLSVCSSVFFIRPYALYQSVCTSICSSACLSVLSDRSSICPSFFPSFCLFFDYIFCSFVYLLV